jgi:hypothetical protein
MREMVLLLAKGDAADFMRPERRALLDRHQSKTRELSKWRVTHCRMLHILPIPMIDMLSFANSMRLNLCEMKTEEVELNWLVLVIT